MASPSEFVREAAAGQLLASGAAAILGEELEAVVEATEEDALILVDHSLAPAGTLASRPKRRKALILLKPEERELIERYRGAGWSGYLIKPLRRSSLASRVLATLNAANCPVRGPHSPEDERVAPATVAGIRVLIAEDNPVNALLVQALLKREGCTVELAGTGDEALQALARSRYDLVLMDMRMPGMDGLAATRKMRASGDETPVIALTANAFEEDRKTCLEAGMNAFLSKPVDAATLKTALARWTNRDSRVKLAAPDSGRDRGGRWAGRTPRWPKPPAPAKSSSQAEKPKFGEVIRELRRPRVALIAAQGFSSGLPFLLTAATLGYWLRDEHTSLKAIGFISWVGPFAYIPSNFSGHRSSTAVTRAAARPVRRQSPAHGCC